MDTLLVIEVGYKFQFFGEDARTAAKTLSIMCIPGRLRYDDDPSEAHLDRNKFAKASIPVHRLSVHVKRLIGAGLKVGVVRQVETAALKKAGDNRNAPFERRLTNLYTKGTYVDDLDGLDIAADNTSAVTRTTTSGGYMLCLYETPIGSTLGTDEKVRFGMLAVHPGTGDVMHDVFEDGFLRSELETRLLHISPCEMLLVGPVTRATEKLLRHLSGAANVFGEETRIERVAVDDCAAFVSAAAAHVTQFYTERTALPTTTTTTTTTNPPTSSTLSLDSILQLSPSILACLSAMITHLTEYDLQHVFDLTSNFSSFSQRTHMLLSGTALSSLEIFRNATDGSPHGSLLWAIDKTVTRPGRRLLRKWLGAPLLDSAALAARTDAVAELAANAHSPAVARLDALLASVHGDLERSLLRVYYARCSRREVLVLLQTLQKVALHYPAVATPADTGFTSPLLQRAVLALPGILDSVVAVLDKIDAAAARADDKLNFLREPEHTEAMHSALCGIVGVDAELAEQRAAIARALDYKTPVPFVTVAGIEFLVEVPVSHVRRVPASWLKVSGTKKVARFHTPTVLRLIAERDRHKEALAAACDAAFRALLARMAAHYQPWRAAVCALAQLDCLRSLSRVAALPGYTRAQLLSSGPPQIHIADGRHPVAEHLLSSAYIPFSSTLGGTQAAAQLITGPNMGGKSSYVRTVAQLCILAQIGSFVPARAAALTPLDAVHTRMGARDNLFAGESTFMVEVSETARILRCATPRSLVLLDELGRGTSTHDGAALAHAVLHHVAHETRCLTLFITHYQNLAGVAQMLDGQRVRNVHMRFDAAVDDAGQEHVTFLYEVADGVAHRSYGLNVARLARVPAAVLEVAREKSKELESTVKKRQLAAASKALTALLQGNHDMLQHLVSSIEEL
ncbi:hypothetical protein TD95_002678 [Thielaviopsis punctulata]|uniref:MutS protein homolog 3 n=1 Tax=Thielaviopsis punctulata TaxID=72032 RepID=A0A0F4ZHS0_9PEZI|nr:hypothetical protein TD95_002678 [Thielaviopsis punctulata]